MNYIRSSVAFLFLMTALLGVIYPLCVWGIGASLFPYQSKGSIIVENGRTVGSELLAQSFTSDRYFWPRPSSTKESPYQTLSSGASNLNPANPLLLEQVKERAQKVQKSRPNNPYVPVDLVTASASGLDPDISIDAALLQTDRIARVRKISLAQIVQLVHALAQKPTLGFLGQERINVLRLNIALDHIQVGAK